MSVNEQAERVEITPELLADIEAKARGYLAAPHEGWREQIALPRLQHVAPPSVVLALVWRIRELESAVKDAIAEHDHQVECWEDLGGDLGTANADYHRLHGDLLRGALLT